MSWKDEFIAKYGKAALARRLQWTNEWKKRHPDYIRTASWEQNRKGCKRYEKRQKYRQTGIPWEREKVRSRHGNQWRPYKHIIAPDSQLHHNWCPNSAEYTGLALVEADAHRHGFIDVIEILEGTINLFTEKEIAAGGEL